MIQTLALQFNADLSLTSMLFNTNGLLESELPLLSLSEITPRPGQKLIVIVPGQWVHIFSIKLPKMSAAELQQAVPHMLEDQLAQDIDSCHFVIGDAEKDNQRLVAVIDQAKWLSLIENLRHAHLNPEIIIPDFLCLPNNTLFKDEHDTMLHKNHSGYTLSNPLAATIPVPEDIQTINFKEKSFANLIDLKNISFNLISHEFRKHKEHQSKRSGWYWCKISFTAMIAIFFIGHVALFTDYHKQDEKLQKQLLQTYQRVFPSANMVSAPKIQLTQLLKQYELTHNPFVTLLAAVAKLKIQFPNIDLSQIQFNQQKMTLSLAASSTVDLNQFTQQLSSLSNIKIINNQTELRDKQQVQTLTIGIR